MTKLFKDFFLERTGELHVISLRKGIEYNLVVKGFTMIFSRVTNVHF
jgi:hypothetical protein